MSVFQKIYQGFAKGFEIIWAISKSWSGDPTAWERSIAKFEAQDRSLYRFDRLHPNKKGYIRWTAVIKPILLADLWN